MWGSCGGINESFNVYEMIDRLVGDGIAPRRKAAMPEKDEKRGRSCPA